MGSKSKQELEADVRGKHGIPADVPVWLGLGSKEWVAYSDGVLVVRSLGTTMRVQLQNISSIELKPASRLSGARDRLSLRTSGDKFAPPTFVRFAKEDLPAFSELHRLLEADRDRGVTGDLSETQPAESLSEKKYRQKFDIPETAVLARTWGEGYVSFDGHFVTIQRHGLGRFNVGKGIKRIPLTAISSIQIKPQGLAVPGFIQFSLAGGNEKTSEFGRQTRDASKDENSMLISNARNNEFEFVALRDAVEAAMRALHSPAAPAADAPAPDDVFVHLEKLGSLRDAGILTEAEFTSKKADLLSRM